MTVGAVFSCGSLPTWAVAQCCQGCHGSLNDVRPTRVRFPAGYPLGADVLVTPAGSSFVLCCRSQLHALMAMAGQPELMLDVLDVTPA